MEDPRQHRNRARPLISPAAIAHWRTTVPWVSDDNVEQDLILSRLMVEIARHPLLGSELVMRGGTCFHKLWLDRPWRYSEDLDYVRRSTGPIKPLIDAIHEIAELVGFDDVAVAIGQHPKARLRSTFNSGQPMRVKIEINTFERSPATPATTRPLSIDSPWYSVGADIPTFVIEELVATKIRALYQRRKGRDLFDLWLAVHAAGVDPRDIAASFHPYRPDGWTPRLALGNLDKKVNETIFATDLDPLVVAWPNGYSIEAGAEVARRIINEVD
jgi:predicted nucleotidyltransferase component of viral defense system